MSNLHLETLDDGRVFSPRALVEGVAGWEMDAVPQSAEIRLFWHTTGKGDRDIGVVDTHRWEPAERTEAHAFKLQLPDGPYSFSGRLITLAWAVELLVEPGGHVQRLDVVVSPTGREVALP